LKARFPEKILHLIILTRTRVRACVSYRLVCLSCLPCARVMYCGDYVLWETETFANCLVTSSLVGAAWEILSTVWYWGRGGVERQDRARTRRDETRRRDKIRQEKKNQIKKKKIETHNTTKTGEYSFPVFC
jgi:hypothetical protein